MTPRFHLGDHGDRSILGRTTEIKITMMRDTDGTVCGGFELSGHLGSDDEELFGGSEHAGHGTRASNNTCPYPLS